MRRFSAHRPVGLVGVGTAIMATLVMLTSRPSAQQPSAQQPWLHLNPAIEKLAQGKPVFGLAIDDLTINIAHEVARADVDMVRIEMEHQPMNFDALKTFLAGMVDKATILKKGNAQLNVMPYARFAPEGSEQAHWVVKQGLDLGLMGVMFNGIETKEEALYAVRSMRYPQPRGSRYMAPAGTRGLGPGNAVWFWGIDNAEYIRRADLWPLNPQGDLLAIIMIESPEGVKNIDEIASVPGVGVIRPGATGDLPMSMGLPASAPEVQAALQTILKSCLAHNVACGRSADARNIQQFLKEGWKFIDIGRSDVGAAMRAARAVLK